MRNIMQKCLLKFRNRTKFCAKNIYIFRMNSQFRPQLVSYLYKNDAEFHEKSHFVQNHAIVAQEN